MRKTKNVTTKHECFEASDLREALSEHVNIARSAGLTPDPIKPITLTVISLVSGSLVLSTSNEP